jgi:hypothetical protein
MTIAHTPDGAYFVYPDGHTTHEPVARLRLGRAPVDQPGGTMKTIEYRVTYNAFGTELVRVNACDINSAFAKALRPRRAARQRRPRDHQHRVLGDRLSSPSRTTARSCSSARSPTTSSHGC